MKDTESWLDLLLYQHLVIELLMSKYGVSLSRLRRGTTRNPKLFPKPSGIRPERFIGAD
jgi:hypothetical protein